MTTLGLLRKRLFGIPSAQAVFRRPGFAHDAWDRFQPVAQGLVAGYHATLEDSRLAVLVPRLEAVDPALRGFAYEGAGMGLAALDCIAPWKQRLNTFVAGPGAPYIYPIYVGVGLALARLRRNPERWLHRFDPLLCWVIVDGYGFHAGFFDYPRSIEQQTIPRQLSHYGRQLFDQGLGRSLWFSSGADPQRVAATIDAFAPERHAELWSGVGLASAYGGGGQRADVEALYALAGSYRSQLRRGAAIAAQGRQHAGYMTPHTALACEIFCGISGHQAAHVTDHAREGLPNGDREPAYEIWRKRVQAHFAVEGS